jgi:hypothetical protein
MGLIREWASNMQIQGFEISVIEAKRFSKQGEKLNNIRVDHNSSVIQINKISDGNAMIDFRFTTNYVGMGYIKIEGQLVLVGEIGPVIDEWTKTGSMPADVANLVHNTVVPNCIPTAMLVARDIRLPPPVPFPRINIQQQKKASSASSGMEVA